MLYFENSAFGVVMSWLGRVSILLVIDGSGDTLLRNDQLHVK